MKDRRVCADENRENGSHMPSSLSGRSIVVVRQADDILAVLKFTNFNFKACLGCLNRFIVLIALYQ